MPIERGLTRDQVVDLIGPPTSTMTSDEHRAGYANAISLGPPQQRGLLGRFRRPRLPRSDSISWVHENAPEGQTTFITFKNGIAHVISSRPYRPREAHPQHEWARALITARIGETAARGAGGAAARAGWQRLTSADALGFVLGADDDAYPRVPGRLGGNARRFDELTVLVSVLDATAPKDIRRQLPGGFMFQLDWLLDRFCVRLGASDVAHWLLCRNQRRGDGTVHLTYLPAETDGTSAVLPVDLLSTKEQRRYLR